MGRVKREIPVQGYLAAVVPTILTSQPIGPPFFEERERTLVAWLGSAGVLINARGTVLLIDPLITLVEMDGGWVTEEGHYRPKFEPPLLPADLRA